MNTIFRRNKLLIANSLRNDIDVVLFLTGGDRFDAQTQLLFQTLNEWTNGQFWHNLLYVPGRKTFDRKAVEDMISNNGKLIFNFTGIHRSPNQSPF
jgi:hypothetical protein